MTFLPLPPDIFHVLHHALGVRCNAYGEHVIPGHRQHYVAGSGRDELAACRAAVADGLMVERPPSVITGGDPLFIVTDRGRTVLRAALPVAPKLTSGQRRYAYYRDNGLGDVFGSFLGYLKHLQAERAGLA